ncbi:MAG: hypothetical protein K9H41_06425 [Bacteroidia bacterium]|nr:hypothetical protein [Bacteroidia bacterium]
MDILFMVYYLKFFILSFFFLDEKETKSEDNSPTTIYPAKACQNGGSHRIDKCQPHHYKRMRNLYKTILNSC